MRYLQLGQYLRLELSRSSLPQSEATSKAQSAEPISHSYSSNGCEWLVLMNEKLKVKNEKGKSILHFSFHFPVY
jgi:hypothetical protein